MALLQVCADPGESTGPDARLIKKLSFRRYAALRGEHATQLRLLLTSPLLYRHARLVEWQETDAMRGGRAVHSAVFEPSKFRRSFVVWTGGRRYGKEWDEFCAKHGRKTILTEAQHLSVVRISEAVRNHPIARRYLEEQGDAELSIRWRHERTGIRLKCRLDWLCSALVDLKTTADPSTHKFSSSAVRFGYPLQLGLYADAVAAAGLGRRPTKIIAVQTSGPHDVVVYDVGEDVLALGRDQYERALDLLARCRASDSWPGMAPDSELPLYIPAWALAANDDEEEAPTFAGEPIF